MDYRYQRHRHCQCILLGRTFLDGNHGHNHYIRDYQRRWLRGRWDGVMGSLSMMNHVDGGDDDLGAGNVNESASLSANQFPGFSSLLLQGHRCREPPGLVGQETYDGCESVSVSVNGKSLNRDNVLELSVEKFKKNKCLVSTYFEATLARRSIHLVPQTSLAHQSLS